MSAKVVTLNAARRNKEPVQSLLSVYRNVEYPFELLRGEGVKVFDSEGKDYIDFYGGHCVALIGHSPECVVEAIARQGRELFFYSNLARVPIRKLGAEKLISFADNGLKSAFFCNSGAEANENALKIAIKSTRRSKICAFEGAFHGRTMLAMSATDNASWHEIYGSCMGPVERITPNDPDGLSKIDSQTAAVILEPIQSIGGVVEFEIDYLRILREACTKAGALLIFDEVQTGMGRTGNPFVSGWCGILPDMMTLAKGLASGFPIGAVVMTEAVASRIEPGDIAATFGAGPMAMAAMIASIDYIRENDLVAHAKHIENYIRKRFTPPLVFGVRGSGCLLGLELGREAKPIRDELFKKGIIAGLCSDKFVLHLLPPLIVEESHVDALHSALSEVMNTAS